MSTKTVKITKKAVPVSIKETPVKEMSAKEVPIKVKEMPVKNKEVVVEAPVATTSESTTPSVVNSEVDVTVTIKQRIEVLIKAKQDQMNEIKKEIQELKKIQKDYEVELKNASKNKKKKRSASSDGTIRKPSGFASPVVVSDSLYKFLEQFGVKHGDPIARTDVTRHITSYISEHKLQNPEFRREIVPDAVLKGLFGEPFELKNKGDANSPLVYTYLQLQKYLSPHFPKKASSVAAEVVVATA